MTSKMLSSEGLNTNLVSPLVDQIIHYHYTCGTHLTSADYQPEDLAPNLKVSVIFQGS